MIDLGLRFGFGEVESTEQTCIIVVQVKLLDGRVMQTGVVVDGVGEVVNIVASDIEETPDFGTAVDTSHLAGMGKIKGKVTSLLDIDRVLAGDDIRS